MTATVGEEEALWRAIGSNPEDALPRLVLADWHQEREGVVVCQAIGPHHHDACSGGRIEAPNPAFTTGCPTCSGTGVVSNGHAETAEALRATATWVPNTCGGGSDYYWFGLPDCEASRDLTEFHTKYDCPHFIPRPVALQLTPSPWVNGNGWPIYDSAAAAICDLVLAWVKVHKGVSL